MTKSGFTLIELMVAMVVGLTAITSVYSLGSAMSEQFYQEQRTATSQGSSRAAIMELRRDISRAGLFGSPNAQSSRPAASDRDPELPTLGGGTTTMGAFQYYPNADLAVLDPDDVNGDRRPRRSPSHADQPLPHRPAPGRLRERRWDDGHSCKRQSGVPPDLCLGSGGRSVHRRHAELPRRRSRLGDRMGRRDRQAGMASAKKEPARSRPARSCTSNRRRAITSFAPSSARRTTSRMKCA